MAQSMRALARVLRTALPAAGALSGGSVLHCTDDGPPRLDDQRALLEVGHDAAEAIDVDVSEVQQQRPPRSVSQCDLTIDDGAPRWEAVMPDLSIAARLAQDVTGLDTTNCAGLTEPAKKRLKPEAARPVDNAFLKELAGERAAREGRLAHSVSAPSASAFAGGFGGVDPNLDPELATALRNSMEDGHAAAGASEPVDTVAYADKDDYEECGAEEGEDDDDAPVFLKSTERDGTGPQAEIAATSRAFGPIRARAAVEVARELGFTRPHLDTPDEKLRENLRILNDGAAAKTKALLPGYFDELSGTGVVGAARDLPPDTLKKVKEKQTHWATLGSLGQLSEQMMGSWRRVLDALARSNRERVADGSHPFLAANRTWERRQNPATEDNAYARYYSAKKRIKAMIEAGDSLSPLQKALAEQFKKDDPDFIYGTAPSALSGPVQMVVDAKQLVESDARIQVLEEVSKPWGKGMRDIPNPRYEETKGATTAKQFIDAGFTRTDLAYDVNKGYVKVLQGEIPKKRKQDHSKRGYWTEQQKDAMAARYLKILDEYDS